MKLNRLILTIALAATTAVCTLAGVTTANLSKARLGEDLRIRFDIVLDSLKLGRNKQLYITPVVEDGTNQTILPTVLVNGRNMHYGFLRGTAPKNTNYPVIYKEVWRKNGTKQAMEYVAETRIQPWMLKPSTRVVLRTDSCGCGVDLGHAVTGELALDLNPAPLMRLAQITPPVTEQPTTVHEGRARVQFEVNRTELHATPYKCQRGNQIIDNRAQLKIIDDSVKYALADPNVEIASIRIIGYASPESPYDHNAYLAINRSRALAEYLGQKYNLGKEASLYDAVPENWKEFREAVVEAKDITAQQRADLLSLIDAPASSPEQYDAKETTLRNDSRFAALYRDKILPEWFPRLRATQFEISTRLKPMPDQQLAEVIKRTPQLLSLNQMFRVARLYREGSDDFNNVIETALKYYPNSEIANLNSAVVALNNKDFDRAKALLEKAGNAPEAENARGVLAAHNGDFNAAIDHFSNAGNLPEAVKNKALLEQ